MFSTVNSVCTIDSVSNNSLILEVMPNNLQDGSPQFYLLDGDKPIKYIDFSKFNEKMKASLSKNGTFYITFCGISNRDTSVPEYLYLVFKGKEVKYCGKEECNRYFLEFTFNKSGQTIEKELYNLFTDNVGVFTQAYL